MKTGVKLLSVILCIAVIFGCTGVAGASKIAEYETGDIIKFGSYPQSLVTEKKIIAVLTENSGNPDLWKSLNYFSGTVRNPETEKTGNGKMKPADYIRYKDITYGRTKYRGIVFDSYRPYSTGVVSSSMSTESFQGKNGYEVNTVYWFKFEPIKWRVLDGETGLVVSEAILDSQPFNNFLLGEFGDAGKTYYSCNYEKSSIRKWLNEDFYSTAFSNSQKELINAVTIDNKGVTEEYGSAETTDKIYLLSYDDAVNSKYGFEASKGKSVSRTAVGSDYAKCQGLMVYDSEDFSGEEFEGKSDWNLRTAGVISDTNCKVSFMGYVLNFTDDTTPTYVGVRPAMRLNTEHDFAASGVAENEEPVIFIENYISELSVDYRSTVILNASSNVVGDILWYYDDGTVICNGSELRLKELRKDCKVYAVLKNARGVTSDEFSTEIETIHVKAGFFDRFVAFIRSLFSALPVWENNEKKAQD